MPSTFSAQSRADAIDFLSKNPVDVAIIGAGAVGCSVAAHLSAIGISCAVIEKEDIAFGASGNSTGLAHAGLRYLAQGRFLYVFHETRERQRLQALAPQWVRPFRFIYPVFRGDPFGFSLVRLGTRLYSAMTWLQAKWHGEPVPPPSRALSADDVLRRVPGLKSDGLQGATEYFVDAQLQDSRFTLGFAQSAHEQGAHVVTHAEVKAVRTSAGGCPALSCEDQLNGVSFTVESRLVVNAAGAWIDELRGKKGFGPAQVEASQGIHLVVDRVADVPLIFSSVDKGRVFFVLPYGRDASLVGTTEREHVGSMDAARPHAAETKELLNNLFRYFPALKAADYAKKHVRDIYWGLRPLLRAGLAASDTSREHKLIKDAPDWWSVVGVKLTAARAAGEEVAHEIARALGPDSAYPINLLPLPGAPEGEYLKYIMEAAKLIEDKGIQIDTVAYLLRLYGTAAEKVAELGLNNLALGERVLKDEPWIYAEVLYACRAELVLRLDDLLWRRTKWAHYRDLPEAVIKRIADILAKELNWTAGRRAEEISLYSLTLKSHRLPLSHDGI